MALLFDRVKKFCESQGRDNIFWVAYSGGLDSHVLLHLMKPHVRQLRAIHINHGVNPNANAWQAHCEKICADLKIDFYAEKIDAKTFSGKNFEEQAREIRYKIFSEVLNENDFLLTAHHQDDQAETVLLQLFRGAGVKGLAAMPRLKKLGKGFHARPLLDCSREELKNYAVENNLQWIEDESNENVSFTRNFIRHEVMGVLKKRWKNVSGAIARSAENCADAQVFIDRNCQSILEPYSSQPRPEDLLGFAALNPTYAAQMSPECVGWVERSETQQARRTSILDIKTLLTYSSNDQKHLLRAWIFSRTPHLPSAKKLYQIQQTLLTAREDKSPLVTWGNTEVRRFKHHLYITKKTDPHDTQQILKWNLNEPLTIKNLGKLNAVKSEKAGFDPSIESVTVRFRQGGERFKMPGRNHHHCLKKLFQEWNVPPWQRSQIPLIFVGEELAAVVGFYVADAFIADEGLELIIFSS